MSTYYILDRPCANSLSNQTLVLECLPSQKIWFSTKLFMEKSLSCWTKLWFLAQQPFYADMYSISHGKIKICFSKKNCFLNSLPERIKFENQGSPACHFYFLTTFFWDKSNYMPQIMKLIIREFEKSNLDIPDSKSYRTILLHCNSHPNPVFIRRS